MNIFDELKNKNSKDFNILKLIEELNELNTALVETYTKDGSMSAVIEECGDVAFRLEAFCKIFNIEQEVKDRYKHKRGQLERKAMLNKLGKSIQENLKLE